MSREDLEVIPFQLGDWLFDPDVVVSKDDELTFDTRGEELRFPYLPDSLNWHADYLNLRIRVRFNGAFLGHGEVSLAITMKAKGINTHLVPLNGYLDIDIGDVDRLSLSLALKGKGKVWISSIDFVFLNEPVLATFTSLKDISLAYSGDIKIERFLGEHLSLFEINPITWKEDLLKSKANGVLLDNYKLSLWVEDFGSELKVLDMLEEMAQFLAEHGILFYYVKLDFAEKINFMESLEETIFDRVITVDKASELRTRNHFNVKGKKINLDLVSKIRGKLQRENKFNQLSCILQQLGININKPMGKVTVVSLVKNQLELKRVIIMFQKQSWEAKGLVIILDDFLERQEIMDNLPHDVDIILKGDTNKLNSQILTAFTAFFCPSCYYGLNYLEDLVLSALHTGCPVTVKGSYGKIEGELSYLNEELQYEFLKDYDGDIKKSVINTDFVKLSYNNFLNFYGGEQALKDIVFKENSVFSIDKYNFLEGLKYPIKDVK